MSSRRTARRRTLVLASRSPRRRELLEEATGELTGEAVAPCGRELGPARAFAPASGRADVFARFRLRVEPPRGEEPPPAPGETPGSYALRLARLKAGEVAARLAPELRPGDLVLGADTVADLGGEVIGKPRDAGEARTFLSRLSGARHAVVTAVVLVEPGTGRRAEAVERTELETSPMSAEEIASYVASGEGEGKAGAYAIQETGDRYVKIVSGSRSNVVGLPLERLAVMLRDFAKR